MAEKQRRPSGKHTKLTRLESALIDKVKNSGSLSINEYQLFKIVYLLYQSSQSLYLRSDEPSLSEFRQLIKRMERKAVIRFDPDYRSKLLSFYPFENLSVEEACCTVDPFIYVSHLSAMQRYGLTERRPKRIYMTTLAPAEFKLAAGEQMTVDYRNLGFDVPDRLVKLTSTVHPQRVRNLETSVSHVKRTGEVTEIRSSGSRISSIGQTFLDMLERPQYCGGMRHILKVWSENAAIHLDDISRVIDQHGSKIAKVRAGYIITELLELEDEKVDQWTKYAQRGGSRVLDPDKPYKSQFSEKWMISINV